ISAASTVVTSPDGRVKIELSVQKVGDTEAVPCYRVLFGDAEIISYSRLGVALGDGTNLGGPCVIGGSETRSHRDSYSQFPGKRREVTDHCKEAVVRLRETSAPGRRWEVVLRAYDDGAAFRYRFPAQDGWNKLVLGSEQTEFQLAGNPRAFALPLNSFTT